MLYVLSEFAFSADDSWKTPLAEKERILEANILKRHNILGLYPSMVEIPHGGAPVDITTATPSSDVVHAVCWTANYLAGASYRYRYLKDNGAPKDVVDFARARADELFEAVYRCQRVTGVRGLQARGYFLGHGPVYVERFRPNEVDEWHQGEADGRSLRWRGNPSHHNYSDSIHGLGQYYDLAAEGTQKERAREAIDALVSYWVDNDLLIYKLDRSRRPVNILGFTDGKTLNTRVMMAIAGAKVAHHATGQEKFQKVYQQLVDQYDVRNLDAFRPGKDFDDAEHVFCHLENLVRIEKDPVLLEAYRLVADGLWNNCKNDAQSLFTYIYFSIRPDAPGRDEAFVDAMRSLVTWPTDTTIQPRMNSLFEDRKPPYPVYQAAWDNEYIWKGNLLRADGWQSRTVTAVDVSPEDEMLIAAADEAGDLYLSRDGAASFDGWRPLERPNDRSVRAVAFGQKSRMLVIACDDGFYGSGNTGQSWKKLPVPGSGAPVSIVFDSNDPFSLYATRADGIYHSRDFGEEFLGESWVSLTDDLPKATSFRFYVALGEPARLYARAKERFFTKTVDETKWTLGSPLGLGNYSDSLDLFAVDPQNASHVFSGAATKPGRFPVRTIVQETIDGGASWSNDMAYIFGLFAKGSLRELLGSLPAGKLGGIAFDAENSEVLYGIPERGVSRSVDGGKSWQVKEAGLEIPLAKSLIVPRHGKTVFVGTPAGLYLSRDQGETWENGHLVLQFTKNRRRELGGAAFIDAYWRARHYGFIDEDAANRPAE